MDGWGREGKVDIFIFVCDVMDGCDGWIRIIC